MGEPSNADISDQIDDFYFTALPNYNQTQDLIPISDENYAKELQLQEFLFSAFTRSVPSAQTERKDKVSSPLSQVVCKICMETLPTAELFRTSNDCSHVFCRDCLSRYLGTEIQENISVVRCPDENCKAVLEPGMCQELLPSEVFER
ncbi:RING/U-box superfamily protein [Rhynchospora pubera]|uniref:RING/U-box superfamily protein n=1 Tax=Rhynchospora pubera TaxID=906938 RepID=A0AAV8HD12_9POAL|nr:RING/U-box superfamily protein [Rhynchospora pubera]